MSTSDKTQHLYPDLIAAGGLDAALSASLLEVGSALTASRLNGNIRFVAYSRVNRGNRSSQVYLAANERLFTFDFWSEGVLVANGKTPDIIETARAIDAWVANDCSLEKLSAFTFVTLTKQALSHENGTLTEEVWKSYLGTIADDLPELERFVALAAQVPQLRQLFPYTSMNRFCFSRCTGYPYTSDTPIVEPQPDGQYVVRACDGSVIGKGPASVAVQLVIGHLPTNCGAAVRGTAETIQTT
jgi:Family of unknown function (DUF6193)